MPSVKISKPFTLPEAYIPRHGGRMDCRVYITCQATEIVNDVSENPRTYRNHKTTSEQGIEGSMVNICM